LAPLLDGVVRRPVLTADGLEWTLEGDSAVVRAVLAWEVLRAGAPGRLRPCANTECALFLIDRSRANNARWCSMAACGNRMKARRHYERVRHA
jgi:predicted RNA-binding Zn ribbon-like protein